MWHVLFNLDSYLLAVIYTIGVLVNSDVEGGLLRRLWEHRHMFPLKYTFVLFLLCLGHLADDNSDRPKL